MFAIFRLVKYIIYFFIISAFISSLLAGFKIFLQDDWGLSFLEKFSITIHGFIVFYFFAVFLKKRAITALVLSGIVSLIEGILIGLYVFIVGHSIENPAFLNDIRNDPNLSIETKISIINYLSSYSYAFYLLHFIGGLILCLIIIKIIFGNKKQLSKIVRRVMLKPKPVSTQYGIIFKAKPQNIIMNNPFRGVYIQGGAGSGKSESIVKPILKEAIGNGYAGAMYDFKGDLTPYVLESFAKFKHTIQPFIVNFQNPLLSHRVNPLNSAYLLKSAYAFEFSEVLINNLLPETIKERKFWDRDAQSILTGIIWFMKKRFPEYCTLPHIISLILECDTEQLLKNVSEEPESSGMVVSLRQAMKRGAEKQVAGVVSTLQTALSRLNTPDIFWLLSGNDFELDLNNPESPKFLCLINDSKLASTYAPAISLILSVSMRLMNQPYMHKSLMLLDEAPTIYIPNFEQLPATARSNKIATVFTVQDYSQMVQKYGQEKAQVLISNLGNQFYGRTINEKSAEMVTKLFSKHDKTYITNSKTKGSSGKMIHMNTNDGTSKNESIQERDRVKINDITNAESGQFFGFLAAGTPREFIKYQFDYDKTALKPLDSYEIIPKTDDYKIEANYLKIIDEAKSILQSNNPDSLINF